MLHVTKLTVRLMFIRAGQALADLLRERAEVSGDSYKNAETYNTGQITSS